MARKTTSKTTTSKRKTSDKDATDKTETDAAKAAEDGTDVSGTPSETAEGSAALSASVDGSDTPKGSDSAEADKPEDTPTADATEPDTSEPDASNDVDPTATGDDTASDQPRPWGDTTPESADSTDTIATGEDTKPEPDPEPRPEPTPAPARTEPTVVHKGGFFPTLLGGVAAGAIGFGVAYFLFTQPADTTGLDALRTETDEKLQSQSNRLDTLTEQLGAGSEAPDLSTLEQGQTDLQETLTSLSDQLSQTQDNLAALSSRVDELESRPLTEGASEAATAAYEAELQKLQDAMAEQRAEIEEMVTRAQQMETEAETTAQATMQRAALARIQTALDAGGGYADAMADLQETGIEVPEVLSSTADSGVPTLAELQESFPEAARAALAAARDAAAEAGETGGLSAFIRTQLGARSLEPREGDDPDAILSRAEAATQQGRLTDALAEIEALPDVARAELTDWAAQATRRLEAVAAAQQLSEELN